MVELYLLPHTSSWGGVYLIKLSENLTFIFRSFERREKISLFKRRYWWGSQQRRDHKEDQDAGGWLRSVADFSSKQNSSSAVRHLCC
jgi:hypothetical protein